MYFNISTHCGVAGLECPSRKKVLDDIIHYNIQIFCVILFSVNVGKCHCGSASEIIRITMSSIFNFYMSIHSYKTFIVFQYRERSEILPIRISVYIFSISSNKSKHLTMTHMQMNCSQTTAHSIYSSIFPSKEDSWDHTIFSNFFLSRDVIASHDVTLLVSFSPARTQLQLHITQLKIDTTCMITIAA